MGAVAICIKGRAVINVGTKRPKRKKGIIWEKERIEPCEQ